MRPTRLFPREIDGRLSAKVEQSMLELPIFNPHVLMRGVSILTHGYRATYLGTYPSMNGWLKARVR